jgi:hypothetical protein
MTTVRWVVGAVSAIAMVALFTGGFRALEVRQLKGEISQLERDRQRLAEYGRRLSASRRVAQADVLEQLADAQGRPVSAILWHEVDADGVLGPPQEIEVVGDLVYFEAAVIKFEHQLVGDGDTERGASLALFRRVFGEFQPAASAPQLNRSLTDQLTQENADTFDERLWTMFWEMMDDPRLAEKYGVRVAQCEAPAVRVKAGQVWEVSIDAAGGLNLRLVREQRDVTYRHFLRCEPAA